MAENKLKVVIQQRIDTEDRWLLSDIVLRAGEIAVSSDKNNNFKIGDGVKKWSEIDYYIDNFIFTGTQEEANLALEAGLLKEDMIINITDDLNDSDTDSVRAWIDHNLFGEGDEGYTTDDDIKQYIDDFDWTDD